MKKNSKISVALHSLIHMIKSGHAETSEGLASCFGTNPVVIRRILGELKKAGIVQSEKGHGGGWVITKNPKDITLYDIYKALDENLLPAKPKVEKGEKCMIIKTLFGTMDEFLTEAEVLLDHKLKKMTLYDFVKQL